MLDFPRWKVWSISLVILIGMLLAIPSMLPAGRRPAYPKWLPSATINLGLDLAGGSQLLLEAEPGDAAKQRLQAMEDQVTTELRRDPASTSATFRPRAAACPSWFAIRPQVDAAVERFGRSPSRSALTGKRDWDVQVVDSTRIVLTPTAGGIEAGAARTR